MNQARSQMVESLEQRLCMSAPAQFPTHGDVNGDGMAEIVVATVAPRAGKVGPSGLIGLLLPAVKVTNLAAGEYQGDGRADVVVTVAPRTGHTRLLFGDDQGVWVNSGLSKSDLRIAG